MDKDLLNIVVAAGGWLVATLTLVLGYFERKSAREEDLLATTLAYFDGGSQRRSIGVSLLEGVWIHKPSSHKIIVPLIANQIVYLLLSSDSHDAHNVRNLVRLVMLLREVPNLQANSHDRWVDVCDAIYQKYEYNDEEKGIPIAKPTLKLWAKGFGRELDA
jgi:hypothetical protein